MSVSVSSQDLGFRQLQSGPYIRRALLTVTGLSTGTASTIAHGLPATPQVVLYTPRVAAGGFETQAADATNLYYTTGASQTALTAYVEY